MLKIYLQKYQTIHSTEHRSNLDTMLYSLQRSLILVLVFQVLWPNEISLIFIFITANIFHFSFFVYKYI